MNKITATALTAALVLAIYLYSRYHVSLESQPVPIPEKILSVDGCDIFSFDYMKHTHYMAKCTNGKVSVTNGETGEILITLPQ